MHLPITMGYDRAPEKLIDEKRAFLEDKLARGVRLFFTHDHDCAVAGSPRRARAFRHRPGAGRAARQARSRGGSGCMMPGQGDSLQGLLLKLVGALLVLAGAALVAVTVQARLAYRTMTVRHEAR